MSRIVYASFDEVPAPKGASTHIVEVAKALGAAFGDVLLLTPALEERPPATLAPGVRHEPLACPDDNPIGRARTFQTRLQRRLARESCEILHFRSPWEGLALLDPRVRRAARVIYEVNGFPSIELKYHYRSVLDDTYLIEKLARQELACLTAADRIVTVSDVNRREIEARGAPADRITVIRNGADPDRFPFQPPPLPTAGHPLLVSYVGTLALWQGVDTLVEAAALYARDQPIEVRIMGSGSRRRRQEIERLADRLGASHLVRLLPAGSHADVLDLLYASHATTAPLLAVDRNTRQGCSPLKVLEAMAAGAPLVASELDVVRELACPEEHFVPCRAGDARSLKNALMRLASDPPLGSRLAAAARRHVETNHTWRQSLDQLLDVYRSLLA